MDIRASEVSRTLTSSQATSKSLDTLSFTIRLPLGVGGVNSQLFLSIRVERVGVFGFYIGTYIAPLVVHFKLSNYSVKERCLLVRALG